MGLCLFPGDGDVDGLDVSFSYGDFALFRRRLAIAEGFDLGEMFGFGGDRPWAEVSTVLEPLLNHPDDHGESLSPSECAVILPRLEAVLVEWLSAEFRDVVFEEHIRDARDLVAVLNVCVRKNVELCFM
ncbi:hypothetical protein [Streptomyces sp. NPDC048603]|uniref:hypothetical protein n=1 Tax=Streptomyces sp. NPDC048603 TaxID=3365577 RepID=UPI0037213DAB